MKTTAELQITLIMKTTMAAECLMTTTQCERFVNVDCDSIYDRCLSENAFRFLNVSPFPVPPQPRNATIDQIINIINPADSLPLLQHGTQPIRSRIQQGNVSGSGSSLPASGGQRNGDQHHDKWARDTPAVNKPQKRHRARNLYSLQQFASNQNYNTETPHQHNIHVDPADRHFVRL